MVLQCELLPPRYWEDAQKLCVVVSQRLGEAQSEAESLETKYAKAKKLVREYQRRCASSPASLRMFL